MKNTLFILIFLIGFFTQAQTNFTTKTINQHTRSIIKMNFHKDAQGDFNVRIYAKCTPKDCDSGSFEVTRYLSFQEYLKRNKGPYVSYYNPITIKK